MKTANLDFEVSKFIQSLQATNEHKERVKICVAKRLELSKAHTPATTRNYLTSYRKALKTTFGENTSLLNNLKLLKAANKKIERTYQNEIQKRTEQHTQTEIADYKGLLQIGLGLIGNDIDSYLKVALGLCLLTGRRATEILKTANFKAVKGQKNMLLFEGQLKLKDRELGAYKIPTLCPAIDILNAVTWLRTKRDFTANTEKEVHSIASKELNNYTKRIFKDFLGKEVTTHDLRKAYAAIGYKLYIDNGGLDSFRIWASNVLGHGGDFGQLTTETYYKYLVK